MNRVENERDIYFDTNENKEVRDVELDSFSSLMYFQSYIIYLNIQYNPSQPCYHSRQYKRIIYCYFSLLLKAQIN